MHHDMLNASWHLTLQDAIRTYTLTVPDVFIYMDTFAPSADWCVGDWEEDLDD